MILLYCMLGILIPFLGTTLGSAMVFLMKNKMSKKVEKILLGFASGVMIAASVWSLIIPSINMAEEQGQVAWIPAAVGFLLGIIFLCTSIALVIAGISLSFSGDGFYANLFKTSIKNSRLGFFV